MTTGVAVATAVRDTVVVTTVVALADFLVAIETFPAGAFLEVVTVVALATAAVVTGLSA